MNLDDLLDAAPAEKESAGKRTNLPPGPGPGRPKGVPNKLTAKIKAAIESALEGAGDDLAANGHGGAGGADTYLRWLAKAEPKTFGALLGKMLPTKIAGSDDPDDKPVLVEKIERVIVKPGANKIGPAS